uniref:Family with sequence similarity 174 member B n=1 Tax=Bos indicus x Bos taurus TaxID=30522 RepID=A0A4W2EHV5_BOBOX
MTRCNVLVAAAAAAAGGADSSGRRSFLPSTAQPPGSAAGGPGAGLGAAAGLGAPPRAPSPAPAPPARTMRAALPPARLLPLLLLLALLGAPAARASRAQSAAPPQPGAERQPRPPPGPGPGNATGTGSGEAAGGGGSSNSSGDALVTRISSLLRDLPTLKAAVIVACAFTAFLIACLLLRVFRSGKRLKKTRKYDIITTPAERVEMAPLNEEDDEDEDSTVFDIKYSFAAYLCGADSHPWNEILGPGRSRPQSLHPGMERRGARRRWKV